MLLLSLCLFIGDLFSSNMIFSILSEGSTKLFHFKKSDFAPNKDLIITVNQTQGKYLCYLALRLCMNILKQT